MFVSHSLVDEKRGISAVIHKIVLGKHGVALWYEQSVTDNHHV
jgi:hypothetical protein